MSSPSPSPRRRANTLESPTRAWNSSNARVPIDRPVSALRTPFKKLEPGTPRGTPNPESPTPKFDSAAIRKAASPSKLSKSIPKKEVKDYEVPVYDFSVRGSTPLKPVVQRRKPLTATPGQAASHIEPKAKTDGVTTAVLDKPHAARSAVVPASAVGLRVKKPCDVPLPDTPVAGNSAIANRSKKVTGSATLSAPQMGSALTCSVTSRGVARHKKAPESVPLPASPAGNVAARVPTKPVKLTMPAMILVRQELKPEVSQASAAELETSLSPGTMKHVAPQLLDSEAAATGKATHPQLKRKQRLAAQASIDGSGLGLSPSKAAKAPAIHVGPSKSQPVIPHPAIDGAFKDPKSPPGASSKLGRQVAPNGDVFLVSTKPLKLQTKLQVSPRSGTARVIPMKNVSPKGQGPALPIKVIMGGGNMAGSSSRLVSDSTSTAADDERDGVVQYSYQAKTDLERRKKTTSEAQAHVLVVDPQIVQCKLASRRNNSASDPAASSAPKHTESIEYQAKQYLLQTLNAKSLLDVEYGAQKDLKTSPPVKSSLVKKTKGSSEYSSQAETAYQAMIMKAYIDERPAIQIKLGRPRTRHHYGSSGQTRVVSDVRDGSSSEFSVDFLKSDASQKIIQQTFVKLDMHDSSWSKQPLASPLREPVSPSYAEYGNFARRMNMSPSESNRAREFNLGWASEQPHGNNFHLSSDHPMSPLRHMAQSVAPSTSTIRSDDAFEHFDDVDYDEMDYSGLCADAKVLEAELQRLERELATVPQTQYPGDQYVDDVAALEVLVDLQAGVGEQALMTTDTTTITTTATTVELPHKSALSMSHRGSVSSHKSVRWDPSIDEIATPVVQDKGKSKAVETVAEVVVEERKSRYELQLEDLFKQASGANGDSGEAKIFGLGLETARTLRLKGEEHKIAGIMNMVREAVAFDIADEEEEASGNPNEVPVATAPPAKLNPLVPEFTPRNVKENAPWTLNLGPCEQYNHTGMLGYEVDDWRKPSPPREVVLRNPSLEEASSPDAVVEENLFHDPAVLSVSPSRKRVDKFGMSTLDSTHQSISAETFVDSLFDSGDPAILRIGQSPSRRLRAISDQTFATTGAISVPATAASQTVRKRVIWDDPDEPGGREVAILSKKYAERFLTRFEEKYPLTGTKAKVVPKKKLEDLPKKLDEDLLLNGVASLKPKKLATDAADVQQRLELLLLKKKEAKVKKMRSASGSGLSEWGVRVEA